MLYKKKFAFLFFIIFSILPMTLMAESILKPFETDNCTMFPDGTRKRLDLWKTCCVKHDLRYWFGGSQEDMDATDLRLKECVTKVAGKGTARLMYFGVRLGHHSPIKNKYKWNWGWTPTREKVPLSPSEIIYVSKELRKLKIDQVDLEEFIKINFP